MTSAPVPAVPDIAAQSRHETVWGPYATRPIQAHSLLLCLPLFLCYIHRTVMSTSERCTTHLPSSRSLVPIFRIASCVRVLSLLPPVAFPATQIPPFPLLPLVQPRVHRCPAIFLSFSLSAFHEDAILSTDHAFDGARRGRQASRQAACNVDLVSRDRRVSFLLISMGRERVAGERTRWQEERGRKKGCTYRVQDITVRPRGSRSCCWWW